MSALLQARQHFHQAFFHRLLDVVAPLCGLDARQTVAENLSDGGRRLLRERYHLLEIAGFHQRHDLVPRIAIALCNDGEINPALDRDGQAHRQHQCDGNHEFSAALEEFHDGVANAHGPELLDDLTLDRDRWLVWLG